MKRIHINNEFTQWAEYLARYFGHDLLIYDTEGRLMWGSPAEIYKRIDELKSNPYVVTVYKDIGQPAAYLDFGNLTHSEIKILHTIIPFIESQLDNDNLIASEYKLLSAIIPLIESQLDDEDAW